MFPPKKQEHLTRDKIYPMKDLFSKSFEDAVDDIQGVRM